jgi:hypothetical protein
VNFGWGEIHIPSTESRKIRVRRMSADAYIILCGQLDCASHPVGIASMKSRGDIGRRYVLNNFAVEPELVSRKRFADISVEVDSGCHTVGQLLAPVSGSVVIEKGVWFECGSQITAPILPTAGA